MENLNLNTLITNTTKFKGSWQLLHGRLWCDFIIYTARTFVERISFDREAKLVDFALTVYYH